MDVRSHSVRHCRDNLWMRSDAGPLVSREFLSACISGYADGEGCFTVSIAPRATLKVGWEVRPSFSVSQNGDRAEVLHALQAYFGCGSIRPDRSDKTLKWETRKLDELVERVVPHFIRFRCSPRNSVTSNDLRSSAGSWPTASIEVDWG
jgi:hypothetical protein